MRLLIFVTFFLTIIIATGCQEEAPATVKIPPQSAEDHSDENKETPPVEIKEAVVEVEPSQQEAAEHAVQEPPRPPIAEDFQGEPQLSLFPRVGDFRPAEDSDRLPYWNTFIEHLVKVTGVAEDQTSGRRGWVFRSIKSIDSVGFFSPLAVEPQTSYRVSFRLSAELAEGSSAGIGILEFDEFLWIPGQYTEDTFKQHFRGAIEGKRLTGTISGNQSFSFTTGPETRMIHMVLFREGAHDRNSVMFDDIGIEEVKSER